MAGTDASTNLRRKLTVVGEHDGAALLPMTVDAAAGLRPAVVPLADRAAELTLAQLEQLQAAPFRRAA